MIEMGLFRCNDYEDVNEEENIYENNKKKVE